MIANFQMNGIKDFTITLGIGWRKVLKCPNLLVKIVNCLKNKLKNCPKCPKISRKFVLKSYINSDIRGMGGLH